MIEENPDDGLQIPSHNQKVDDATKYDGTRQGVRCV